jgi:hypothetical protein
MKHIPAVFVSLLVAVPYVAGHGYVMNLTIAGQLYDGNFPGEQPSQASGIREISDQSPVKGAANPSLNCGLNAQNGSQVLNANPGDNLTCTYASGLNSTKPLTESTMYSQLAHCRWRQCKSVFFVP